MRRRLHTIFEETLFSGDFFKWFLLKDKSWFGFFPKSLNDNTSCNGLVLHRLNSMMTMFCGAIWRHCTIMSCHYRCGETQLHYKIWKHDIGKNCIVSNPITFLRVVYYPFASLKQTHYWSQTSDKQTTRHEIATKRFLFGGSNPGKGLATV